MGSTCYASQQRLRTELVQNMSAPQYTHGESCGEWHSERNSTNYTATCNMRTRNIDLFRTGGHWFWHWGGSALYCLLVGPAQVRASWLIALPLCAMWKPPGNTRIWAGHGHAARMPAAHRGAPAVLGQSSRARGGQSHRASRALVPSTGALYRRWH